jgi:outer membrane immunogenic protein
MAETRRRLAAFAAGAILTAMPAPAISAGLLSPADPPISWSGFYLGGQLGGAWSEADYRFTNANFFNTLGPVVLGRDFGFDADGVIGGGQLGYNYQTGRWVLGVEGSLGGAALDAAQPSPFFPTLDRYSTETGLIATVTGRVGYAHGRWLAYGKGGWAGADIELTMLDRTSPVRANSSRWADGWTGGGGLEYAIGRALSLGVEYNFIGLETGAWRLRCPGCGTDTLAGFGTPVVDGDVDIQSVTARVNYRFGK